MCRLGIRDVALDVLSLCIAHECESDEEKGEMFHTMTPALGNNGLGTIQFQRAALLRSRLALFHESGRSDFFECGGFDDVVDETSDPQLARTQLDWWREELMR